MSIGHLASLAAIKLRKTIMMLKDGVAFPETTRLYRVFSHEGDELGTLNTCDVENAIHFMKTHGVEVGKLSGNMGGTWDRLPPAYTFAWQGWREGL